MNRFLVLTIFLFLLTGFYFYLGQSKTAVITTQYPGANAQEVDLYLTQKLEEELKQVDEIEHTRCYSRAGLSVIYVDLYKRYYNLQPIYSKIRRRVITATPLLPDGVQPFVDDEYGDFFPVIVTISSRDFSYRELKGIADKARREFIKLENSAKVQMFGDIKQVLFLTYSDSAQYKLSANEIADFLSKTNIITNDGDVMVDGNNIIISFDENFISPKDLEKTQISINGKNVALGDIFGVKFDIEDPPKAIVQKNGEKAIVLAISVKKGKSLLTLRKQVKKSIKKLNKELPIGINLNLENKKFHLLKITLPYGEDIYETKKVAQEIGNSCNNKKTLTFIGVSPPRFRKDFNPEVSKNNVAFVLANSKSSIRKAKKFCDRSLIKAEIFPFHRFEYRVKKAGAEGFDSNWGQKVPAIKLEFDKAAMARLDVTSKDIAVAVKAAYDGYKISSFYDGKNKVDILYRMNEKLSQSIENIDSITLYSPSTEENFPLGEVVKTSLEFRYPEIYRQDCDYVTTIKFRPRDLANRLFNFVFKFRGISLEQKFKIARWTVSLLCYNHLRFIF